MRIYVTPQDSQHLYLKNRPSDFRIQLPEYLEGRFECSVVQYSVPLRPTKPVYIYADFVQPSILNGRYQSILCMVNSKTKEFQNIAYIPVKSNTISTLHIKLVNREGNEVLINQGDTLIVLDFQPV